MKFLCPFLILISFLPAQADVNFSAFGGSTSGSSNSTVSAGYDGEFELNNQVPIDYFLGAQSGRSQFTTTFVEGLPETETKTSNYGIGMGLTLFEMISLSYDFSSESINSGVITAKEYRIAPGLHVGKFSVSYAYGKKKFHKLSRLSCFQIFPN